MSRTHKKPVHKPQHVMMSVASMGVSANGKNRGEQSQDYGNLQGSIHTIVSIAETLLPVGMFHRLCAEHRPKQARQKQQGGSSLAHSRAANRKSNTGSNLFCTRHAPLPRLPLNGGVETQANNNTEWLPLDHHCYSKPLWHHQVNVYLLKCY